MIRISLQPEYIFSLGGLKITNAFLTSVLDVIFLLIIAIFFYSQRNNHKNILVRGIRVLVFEILKIVDMVTEDRKFSEKILPLIATFFIFISGADLLALIPGFLGSFFIKTPAGRLSLLRSPNSSLTTTVALALFSVIATQYFSIKKLGYKKYLGRFLNFANPLKLVLGFFRFISELTKILSFSFRLFGNIFGGEVMLLVVVFLTMYIVPVPFMLIVVFDDIIQAFIFSILTLVFIKASLVE